MWRLQVDLRLVGPCEGPSENNAEVHTPVERDFEGRLQVEQQRHTGELRFSWSERLSFSVLKCMVRH